ncbi:MAG: DUF4390 domain-containing protein [Pseudomonadota bacterium]
MTLRLYNLKYSVIKKTTVSVGLYVCLFLSLLMPMPALAENMAVIESIKLANTRDDLLTYFDVKKAFNEKIVQAVHNGIPTTFSFYITLYKTDGSWFDKKIADIQIKSTLKYNSLKKEYSVTRPWKDDAIIFTQSFDEAKALMTEIDNQKIIPLNQLVKGDKYQLRIKAELDKVTLPLSLHYVLFFVSFWDFETNWYLINFTY